MIVPGFPASPFLFSVTGVIYGSQLSFCHSHELLHNGLLGVGCVLSDWKLIDRWRTWTWSLRPLLVSCCPRHLRGHWLVPWESKAVIRLSPIRYERHSSCFPDLIATHRVEECDCVHTLEFAIIVCILSSPCIERARQIGNPLIPGHLLPKGGDSDDVSASHLLGICMQICIHRNK